jgi:hypothetical protein
MVVQQELSPDLQLVLLVVRLDQLVEIAFFPQLEFI